MFEWEFEAFTFGTKLWDSILRYLFYDIYFTIFILRYTLISIDMTYYKKVKL